MGPVRRPLGLLASGLSLTISWPRGAQQPAFTPRALSPTPSPAPSFPAQVVRELAALHAGTTPAAWVRTHPADSLARFELRLAIENDHRWCARTVGRTILADGTPVLRYAYFYPPAAPPSLALPPAPDPQLVRARCRLGAIWLEAPAADSLSGGALAAATRDALTQAYGPLHPAPDVWYTRAVTASTARAALSRLPAPDVLGLGLHFLGALHWRVAGRWQPDSTVVVSAYDKGTRAGAGRVLACAVLPFAGLGSFPPVAQQERAVERKVAALAAQAARLSGLDRGPGGPVDRLLALLAAAERAFTSAPPDSARARARVVHPQVLAVLREWITASHALDAPYRAAALLAADQVLGSQAVVYVLGQDDAGPTRRTLTGLGAQFVHDELERSENYAHSWLDEARRLDSAGRAGQLATLALLRLGFNETDMCGGGKDASQRVSAAAEQLLRSVTNATVAAEVHVLAGNGYADVVALAAGAGSADADASAYTGAAPDARRRAIRHYRQGIALDRRSADVQAVWVEAWRLLAGLPPPTTYFFCVYD
jgi:hypothetical protein